MLPPDYFSHSTKPQVRMEGCHRLALSSLLLSVVSAPTIPNAASEPNAESPKALSQLVVLTPAAMGSSTMTSSTSSWANPLELAKIYATDTLEDWNKTLEQYKTVAGNNLSKAYITSPMVALEPSVAVESIAATPLTASIVTTNAKSYCL
jgi:hypothetical protein